MDRNSAEKFWVYCSVMSLSARRAWIEIQNDGPSFSVREVVALRKESVDRNNLPLQVCRPYIPSLSARRAWIEINGLKLSIPDVDCRSPQGERG